MDLSALLIIAIGAAAVAASIGLKKSRSRALPEFTDSDFLQSFPKDLVREHRQLILEERRRMARVLGLSPSKLPPTMSYNELKQILGFLAEVEVAWSDLEYDLREECLALDTPFRDEMMKTVRSYIESMVRIRVRSSISTSSNRDS